MASQFFGLINGGATCWLNATYQSLISLDPLMEVLLRCATELKPAHLALAHEINSLLLSKFFGFGYMAAAPMKGAAPIPLEILVAQIDPSIQETFIKFVSLIGSLSNPESFYACQTIKELYGMQKVPESSGRIILPLATCALIRYGQSTARDAEPRDAALRLFCALVIYCAATDARPVPEYHSIGEVGPAMLETIIGALCFENMGGMKGGISREKEIRDIFRVRTGHSACLCFEHAQQFMTDVSKQGNEISDRYLVETESDSMCVGVVPPCTHGDFVSSVQVAIDTCEKNCSACVRSQASPAGIRSAGIRSANECLKGIPGVMSVEIHEQFGPVIVIMTDDTNARGLTRPSVTSVYRRLATGPVAQTGLRVPREITILSYGAGTTLVTYRLVAQIIQEGGHFTAMCARTDPASKTLHYAYASDMNVSSCRDMTISPGACALFYTRVEHSEKSIASVPARPIITRAICQSTANYVELNQNLTVVSSNGVSMSAQLQPAQSIANINCVTTDFKSFYQAALGIQIALALRVTVLPTGLEALFENKIGIAHAGLIAQMVFRVKPIHKFEPDDFAVWRFWIDPAINEILCSSESDHLRAELINRIRTQVNPLRGLAADPFVTSHPKRDILIQAIEVYTPQPIRVEPQVQRSPNPLTISSVPSTIVQPPSRHSAPIITIVGRGVATGVAATTVVAATNPRELGLQPIFPRRQSHMSAMPRPLANTARPAYISPELSLTYERLTIGK